MHRRRDQAMPGSTWRGRRGPGQGRGGPGEGRVDQAKAARDMLPNGASSGAKRQADAVVAGAQARWTRPSPTLDGANARSVAPRRRGRRADAQVESAQSAKLVAEQAADAADANRVGALAALAVARTARSS